MAESARPLGDQNTFLALIGHVCLQWALLEHTMLAVIAAAENLPAEKAYNYFGSMDMQGRIGMAIHLANDAKWPVHMQNKLKEIRKALSKDGENLLWKRNQAVHGVHAASGVEASFKLTLPRERGVKRELDVSINDLHVLVVRLSELVAVAWGVFEEYGQWKFGTRSEKDIDKPDASRAGLVLNIKHNIKSALERLLRNH